MFYFIIGCIVGSLIFCLLKAYNNAVGYTYFKIGDCSVLSVFAGLGWPITIIYIGMFLLYHFVLSSWFKKFIDWLTLIMKNSK